MSGVQRAALALGALVLVALGASLVSSEQPDAPTTVLPAVTQVEAPVAHPPRLPDEPVAAAAAVAVAPLVTDAGAAADPTLAAAVPDVEVAPSPFDDPGSPELQYAVKLVLEGTDPVQWQKAAEVFQRCVDASPKNFLCARGVRAAWERLDSDGGPATSLRVVDDRGTVTPRLLDNQVRTRPDGVMTPRQRADLEGR